MPIGAIGLGIGAIGAIGGLFSSHSANKKLGQLQQQDPGYTANPIAAQRLSLAQSLLNARMPGATYEQQNIYGNENNANANVQKNATSGSQALALEAANQGQTNQQFAKLGEQENQNYEQRYQNYTGAQEGQIAEGDKVFQSQVRQFQDKAQIQGAQAANTRNAWGSLSNLGFGLANYGAASQKQGAPPNGQMPYAPAMPYGGGGYGGDYNYQY